MTSHAKRNIQLARTKALKTEYSPEMISKLLGAAETRHGLAPTTASKSWLTLVKLVAKLMVDNTDLRLALSELHYDNMNHDLHLAAIEAKTDRALKQLHDQRQDA